jgi:hypothetical protein
MQETNLHMQSIELYEREKVLNKIPRSKLYHLILIALTLVHTADFCHDCGTNGTENSTCVAIIKKAKIEVVFI